MPHSVGLSILLPVTWKQALPRVSDGGERQRQRQRSPGRNHSVFHNLISEVTFHHFCHILLVTQTNPDTVWEGLQGCEYQEVRIIWVILEVGCDRK